MSMVTGCKARSCAASVVNDNLKRSVSEAFFRVTRKSLHVANAQGVYKGHGPPAPRSIALDLADYPPLLGAPQYPAFRRPFTGRPCDLVLSSGFLAFANHAGFLQAVEEAEIEISGIMGTSAGALTGSLFAAGMTASQVAREFKQSPPIEYLRLLLPPMRDGSVSMIGLESVVAKLRTLLPPTFEELQMDFAVGVVDKNGNHVLINSGPLPEAVAASAAIPLIFAPVHIPGQRDGPFRDGGLVCRTGLKVWRDMRRQQMAEDSAWTATPPVLLHLVERSSRFSGNDDVNASGEKDVLVVRSPRSGVSFFSLGNFGGQLESARLRTMQELWVH
eukprot:jgi/Botrbrau1/15386/Bobra.43_2s0014.1